MRKSWAITLSSLTVLTSQTNCSSVLKERRYTLTGQQNLSLICTLSYPSHIHYVFTSFERMGWSINVAVMPYGEEWRKRRKVCQKHFNAKAAQSYELLQTMKVRQLLQGLLDTPEQFEAHNKMCVCALTFSHSRLIGWIPPQVFGVLGNKDDVRIRGCRPR